MIEIVEQGRGYFDRAQETGGIHGPPAVLKAITERCQAVLRQHRLGMGFRPTQGDNYKEAKHGWTGAGDRQAFKDTYRQGYGAGYQRGYYGR